MSPARQLEQPRHHGRAKARHAAAFGAALIANLSLGCLGDDALDDEIAAGGSGAVSAMGGRANTAGAPSGGVGGVRGVAGTGGSAMTSRGGTGVDSGGAATTAPDDEETDSGATSTGETGVFVGMTAAHNAARAALDEGLPDLSWSPEIATFSQQWADHLAEPAQCGTIQHRDQQLYGENLAISGSTRGGANFSAEDAVAGWVAEEACWDFGTIRGTETCDSTCTDALHSNGCGHYTQVIWRKSLRVGCGYSTCVGQGFNFEIWVCNYDPPGNFIGQTPY